MDIIYILKMAFVYIRALQKAKRCQYRVISALPQSRVILIDDKATNLADVEQMAKKRGVEFIGLRYPSASLIRKSSFQS